MRSSFSSAVAVGQRTAEEQQQALFVELRSRGIYKPGPLLAHATPDAIAGAIRWWDEHRERDPQMSAGILANVITDGGMPGYGQAPACPWTPALAEAWSAVITRLEELSSEDDWIMRYAPWMPVIHPHIFSETTGWTLGAEPWALGWFGYRLKALRKAAGAPIALIACADTGAPS